LSAQALSAPGSLFPNDRPGVTGSVGKKGAEQHELREMLDDRIVMGSGSR